MLLIQYVANENITLNLTISVLQIVILIRDVVKEIYMDILISVKVINFNRIDMVIKNQL